MESSIGGVSLPPGALLNLLQRGLSYTEAELCCLAASSENGASTSVSLQEPLTLIEAVTPEALSAANPKLKVGKSEPATTSSASNNTTTAAQASTKTESPAAPARPCNPSSGGGSLYASGNKYKSDLIMSSRQHAGAGTSNGQPGPPRGAGRTSTVANGPSSAANNGEVSVTLMEVDHPQPRSSGLEIPKEKVMFLKGHDSEVFICAWNPKADYLASGSVALIFYEFPETAFLLRRDNIFLAMILFIPE